MRPTPPSGEISSVLSSPNVYTIYCLIATVENMEEATEDLQAEPYTHANMIFLGKYSFVFESTVRTCNIKPFDSSLGITTDVPIVDGAVAYYFSFTYTT